MAKQFTIRGILEDLINGKVSIDKAEHLLKRKISREGFYRGVKVLKESFQEIYNETERRIQNDEGKAFRGSVSIDGAVSITKCSNGNSDNRTNGS